LCFFAAFVIGHAVLFSHRIANMDGSPLQFRTASALAMVYLGICTAFAMIVSVIGLLSYAMV
ncbi:MAG: hypothetical protein ACRCZF_20820, partial [Gemmataceae bacterium]